LNPIDSNLASIATPAADERQIGQDLICLICCKTRCRQTPASKFDRSYAAAIGALEDQGVRITFEDRSAGVVQRSRNGIEVSANVRTQADGSVRVAFNTSGATAKDPELIDRVTQSYNRLMSR